jgi:phage shock protein PspC (stress-responsive transcriptional regulator)
MKRFYRLHDDRKIFGICGGIGEYTNTDPLIWRLLFFFLIFTSTPIITGYLITTILTKSI